MVFGKEEGGNEINVSQVIFLVLRMFETNRLEVRVVDKIRELKKKSGMVII